MQQVLIKKQRCRLLYIHVVVVNHYQLHSTLKASDTESQNTVFKSSNKSPQIFCFITKKDLCPVFTLLSPVQFSATLPEPEPEQEAKQEHHMP